MVRTRRWILKAYVHQDGGKDGRALCGAEFVMAPGQIVTCPGCWKVMGWCRFCGCPPERQPCAHEHILLEEALEDMYALFRRHSVSLTCTGVEPRDFLRWNQVLARTLRWLNPPVKETKP